MGMYDYIMGDQVKCFGKACFYGEEGVSPMGGVLQSFEKGDKVPYKTTWYDYSPNFIVFDMNPMEEEDVFLFHLILDGKVKDTFALKDMKDEYFEKVGTVIGYVGELLTVRSIEDCKKMKEDYDFFERERNILYKKVNDIWKEIYKLQRKKREASSIDEQNEILKEIDVLLEEADKEKEKVMPLIEDIRKARVLSYLDENENYAIYQKIGLYLEAIKDYSTSKKEDREALRDKFFEVLSSFEDREKALEIYAKYSKTNLGSIKKKIEDIEKDVY